MEASLQKLKELVSWVPFSYAVIWKIGSYDGFPVWHQGYFNEFAEAEVGQAQQFESIYHNCQFTPGRPGYAYLAWQQQAPFWWTKPMEPVLTDESKEFFLQVGCRNGLTLLGMVSACDPLGNDLQQARIQTLVCFPGRAQTDGSGYCIELATTSLIGESDYQLRIFIQEFLDKQIAPHIYGIPTPSAAPLSQTVARISMEDVSQAISTSAMSGSHEELALSQLPSAVAMAEGAVLNSALLTGITQASVEPEEALGSDFDLIIVRPEEPYFPWTHSGGTMGTYISTGMTPQGMFFQDTPAGSISFPTYANLVDIDILDQPLYQGLRSDHQIISSDAEWASETLPPIALQSTLSGTASGSRKGKEIVVEDIAGPVTEISPHVMSRLQREGLQKLAVSGTQIMSDVNLPRGSLQGSPPMAPQFATGTPDDQIISPRSSSYNRRIALLMPGHSSRSPFLAHRHAQFPRVFRSSSKRQALIHRWAKHLAPQILAQRGTPPLVRRADLRGGPGSSSPLEGSPGADLDPRSPNSLAHERDLAHAHKIKERNRRKEFNKRLQTLISIVPMSNKKDKVSVLTKTIDHIRHLRSRITQLEQGEDAAPTTSRVEEIGATTSSFTSDVRDEDQLRFFNTEGAGPSSSSSTSRPDVVVQKSPGGEAFVIKAEANNHSRSLLQLLNVFEVLDFGVITVDYGCMSNGRFRANLCVQDSKGSRTSAEELEATLVRVLKTGDSLPIGSD